jgi:hypothetical protein
MIDSMPRKISHLTGERVGRWTILGLDVTTDGLIRRICRCDCGVERSVHSSSLSRKECRYPRSCGCARIKIVDLAMYQREWRRSHPEYKEKSAIYREARKEYYNSGGRARNKKKRELAAERPRPEICELCLKPETHVRQGRVRELCWDHCHSTGKFRGWLCSKCNGCLGLACDDPGLLIKMADYLKDFYKTNNERSSPLPLC